VEGAVALELEPVAAISFVGGDCARAAMVDGEEGVTAVQALWWCRGGGGEDGGGFPSLAAHPL
jgi:hypothetical protein